MATASQQRKERDVTRAFRLSVFNSIVLAVSFIFGVVWQFYQKYSYEKQFGKIEASVVMLTATVAPQLLQAVNDNLKTALIETTTQPNQASEALAKVENDTANLRKLKAKLPDQNVRESAALLEKAVSLHPDNSYAWGAAAQMVSYRSDLRSEPKTRPDCYKTQGPGEWDGTILVRYHDCTLDISNVAGFFAVEPRILKPGQNFDVGIRYKVNVELDNGTVYYSGGQMIQIIKLICQNCSFDFPSPKTIPPASGRALSQQLLVADLSDVSLNLPQG